MLRELMGCMELACRSNAVIDDYSPSTEGPAFMYNSAITNDAIMPGTGIGVESHATDYLMKVIDHHRRWLRTVDWGRGVDLSS